MASNKNILRQKSIFALVLSLVVMGACTLAPQFAFAEDIDTDPTPDQLQLEVERTAAALDEATQRADQAAADLAENESRIAELEELIPGQQERSDAAARELYKMNQQPFGILDALFSSRDLSDFIVQLDYVNRVTDANLSEIQRLSSMKKELEESRQSLEQLKSDADAQVNQASAALAAAQQARMEAQRKAEEEARRQAEAAAAAAAAAAKSAKKAEQAESQDQQDEQSDQPSEDPAQDAAETAAETTAASDEAVTQVNDTADWTSDQETFINEWTARIDAYLAGSPLAGYGKNFAEAAWTYGVDPRWSPAISCTESGKGAQCFLPHNAWGWGSVSWDSWEEAIDSHVRGLARGYGYTISMDAARKYCPPNAKHWYETTVSQMNMI